MFIHDFQSPFSGDLDCEEYDFPQYFELIVFPFQSPFSGDLDCEVAIKEVVVEMVKWKLSIPVFRGSRLRATLSASCPDTSVSHFQSPFSGDLDCELYGKELTIKDTEVLSIPVFRGSRLRESFFSALLSALISSKKMLIAAITPRLLP